MQHYLWQQITDTELALEIRCCYKSSKKWDSVFETKEWAEVESNKKIKQEDRKK